MLTVAVLTVMMGRVTVDAAVGAARGVWRVRGCCARFLAKLLLTTPLAVRLASGVRVSSAMDRDGWSLQIKVAAYTDHCI